MTTILVFPKLSVDTAPTEPAAILITLCRVPDNAWVVVANVAEDIVLLLRVTCPEPIFFWGWV